MFNKDAKIIQWGKSLLTNVLRELDIPCKVKIRPDSHHISKLTQMDQSHNYKG